ncbi:unnamed protein product [Chilo suppressalis]|uniref:DNA repair metallo-beta-lactamase domain-containing protein n=1 Tax=Chilo suppressalis TaxID=168631 RepID=A0ABN8B8L3_CHISP|nr:unnamed protein product [Chilo suppressalis]
MNENNDINNFIPSLLNPRSVKKDKTGLSLTQNSVTSRCSLSLRKNNGLNKINTSQKLHTVDKENSQNVNNLTKINLKTKLPKNCLTNTEITDIGSVNFSAIEDLDTVKISQDFSPLSCLEHRQPIVDDKSKNINESLISISSATDLIDDGNDETVVYDYHDDMPKVSVSFGVKHSKAVDVSTNKSCLKRIYFSTVNGYTSVDCDIIECSQISSDSNLDENMNETVLLSPREKAAVAVNLEIKRKKVSNYSMENSKVLILNTNAIENLTHVIVQPPNYKLVKRQILNKRKINSGVKKKSIKSPLKNGQSGDKLKQRYIEEYFSGKTNVCNLKLTDVRVVDESGDNIVTRDVDQEMSKTLGVADAVKCDRIGKGSCKIRRDNESPRPCKPASRRSCESPRHQDIKTSCSDTPHLLSPKQKNESLRSHSPRKNVDSIQFSLSSKTKSIKSSNTPRSIPHHKIVAGTHFAVDAFSYGDIPNVKHYFLTHFHSDHYSGLKKGFNKLLYCSKITAELCMSRLGVNAKYIHIINPDESMRVEGVEVMAVDANHCPGALMLVFTLPNGKTLLHTGDFRATPAMESYPIFWNRDIHTVYLDTTYCNPHYDFPTQDQSLEMALYLLRQKKTALEQNGKKFSSVLIVCGTYTIGKEKFFLGMARRVGCSVWACPEKDRVLQAVEGHSFSHASPQSCQLHVVPMRDLTHEVRKILYKFVYRKKDRVVQAVEGHSFSHASPQSCQLHVVPMRDLTHEKLRRYLDSLQGAFHEIVAFKPSGWENGKNSSVEKDMVTIHGIPYSEHSSFSELIRFVKFLKPKQVVPTVDISGGIKAVQKYFPCPLVYKEDIQCQSKLTEFFSIQHRQQVPAVT